MAPAAVQTKHCVSTYRISAPALFTHASMAAPFTPSRSPMARTRLPLSSIMTDVSLSRWYVASRFQDKRNAVRHLRHPAQEQAALGHEEDATHPARGHGRAGVGGVAHRGGDVALGGGVAGNAVARPERLHLVTRHLAAHGAERADEPVVPGRDVAAAG